MLVNFIHDPQHDPKRLILHFDMGELPEHEPLLALLGLMHLNLLSGSKTTGVFALDPVAVRLMYTVHFFEPNRSPARAVVNALREHAQKVKVALALMNAAITQDGEAARDTESLPFAHPLV